MIKYLEPGSGKAQSGYFWTLKRPGSDAVFHWATTRAAAVLERIVPAEFGGVIQCDGYSAYPAFAKRHGQPLTLAACWAHARREFVEAGQSGAHRADALLIVRLIGRLYAIEARLRSKRASAKQRAVTRSAESRPVIERIGAVLRHWKKSRRHLPQSQMGKAIDYTLTLWPGLRVFLEDGRIEIDNNEVENAIRPTAVGKKNYPSLRSGSAVWLRLDDAAIAARRWLFIGEAQTGERSAIVFTIIEACRRRRINPFAYLRDVFTRMPAMAATDYPSLTPAAWAAARQPAKPASKPSSAAPASTLQRRCA